MAKQSEMETQVEAVGGTMVENALAKFSPADSKIAELRQAYAGLKCNGLADKQAFDAVHDARMVVVRHRVAVEKTRVALKADALEFGRRVDGEAKRLTSKLLEIEEPLEREENAVLAEKKRIADELAAKAEAARKAKLDARIAQVQQYGPLTAPVSRIEAMTDGDFAVGLEATRVAFEENKAAKAELERQRVAREQAEALERQHIEAAEREAKRIEGERIAQERAELELQRAEQEKVNAEERRILQEREELSRSQQKRLDIQREDLAKEAARIQAEKDKTAKAEADALAAKRADEDARNEAARKAALATDAEQVLLYIEGIQAISVPRVWCSAEISAIVGAAVGEIRGLLP